MKALHLSAALAVLPTAFACAETIPVAFAAARYEKMLADSPFALATPTEKPKDLEPSWSANLYLGPVWRIVRDGVEREYAVVKSRADISGSFTLIGKEPGPDGIQLESIQWNDDITKTEAIVRKGTETVPLKPDQSAPSAVPPPQPRPNNGQPGMQNGGLLNSPRRPAVPGVPQPSIPRPTTIAPPVNPAAQVPNQNNQANPNAANDRKRIRVINSK
jgi:hypothetical protein